MKKIFSSSNANAGRPQNDEFDGVIDALLKSEAPELPASFTESVLSKTRDYAKNSKKIDRTADRLLAELKDFPSITERTMAQISSLRKNWRDLILSYSAAAAFAACAVLAVLAATVDATLPHGTITADDFAEMSKIDAEINGIAALVIQEELLDVFKKM